MNLSFREWGSGLSKSNSFFSKQEYIIFFTFYLQIVGIILYNLSKFKVSPSIDNKVMTSQDIGQVNGQVNRKSIFLHFLKNDWIFFLQILLTNKRFHFYHLFKFSVNPSRNQKVMTSQDIGQVNRKSIFLHFLKNDWIFFFQILFINNKCGHRRDVGTDRAWSDRAWSQT